MKNSVFILLTFTSHAKCIRYYISGAINAFWRNNLISQTNSNAPDKMHMLSYIFNYQCLITKIFFSHIVANICKIYVKYFVISNNIEVTLEYWSLFWKEITSIEVVDVLLGTKGRNWSQCSRVILCAERRDK